MSILRDGTAGKEMPSLWEKMHGMWKEQPPPEGLQKSHEKSSHEKPEKSHRVERAVHDTQQDIDTPDHEFGMVGTKTQFP